MAETFICEAISPTLDCIVCGHDFSPKYRTTRCCGPACTLKQRHITRSANARVRNERRCQHCGLSFQRRNPSGKARRGEVNEGRYCSRKCVNAQRKVAAQLREQIAKRTRRLDICACGVSISRWRTRCADCATAKRRAEWRVKYDAERRDQRQTPRPCRKCSTVFVPADVSTGRTYRRFFCSSQCGEDYHKDAAGTTHRKRARYHGVEYEYINPLKVLERDNYRCQVCGIATPKRLRGSTDDRAPELDHRIPMAMGGAHVWANVQCACRRCNAAKGGTVVAGQTNFFDRIESPRRHRLASKA